MSIEEVSREFDMKNDYFSPDHAKTKEIQERIKQINE